MTRNVILRLRSVPPVPGEDEIAVSVPQLVRYNLRTISIPQGLYSVSMPPVVKGATGQAYELCDPFMCSEGR